MMRSVDGVSSHSGLISSETLFEKRGGCFDQLQERGIWLA